MIFPNHVIAPKLTVVKVRWSEPVNMDTASLIITGYDEESEESWYVKELVWQEFKPFEVLDISQITFAGRTRRLP